MKELTEKQKQKALDMASNIAKEADETKIAEAEAKVESFKGKKVLASVWDNIKLLAHLMKNPYVQGSTLLACIGAILYLVSPLDVIPDVLPMIGLLDDVAVILAVFPVVINAIKKDPKRALKIVDTLPPELKKTASIAFGVAGGAIAGGVLGAKVGEELKHISLTDTYEKIGLNNLNYKEAFDKVKGDLSDKAQEIVRVKLEKQISLMFAKKYRRSLEIVVLFLLSLLFSLSPLKYNVYYASLCLLVAYTAVLVRGIISIKNAFPYIKEVCKAKSFYKGIEKVLKTKYEVIAKTEKVLAFMNIKPSEEEMKHFVVTYIKAFRKQLIIFILGFALITLGFWLFRTTLFHMNLDKGVWEVLFYPFIEIFTK